MQQVSHSILGNSARALALVIACWLFVFTFRLIPVGGSWDAVASSTYLLMGGWLTIYVLAWFAGCAFVGSGRVQTDELDNARLVLILCGISAFGALLLGYEFAINRGYGFVTRVTEIRILEVDASRGGRDASLLGGLGRLTMPALFMAWILYRLEAVKPPTWISLSLYGATVFTLYVQAIFEGGRFFVVALFLVVVLTKPVQRHAQKRKRSVLLPVFGVIVFGFAAAVFLDRALAQGQGLESAFMRFATGFPLSLNSDVAWGQSSILESIYFVIGMLWLYITSALNDLDILLRDGITNHAWGAYQFPQIWAVIGLVTGYQSGFTAFELSRPGVYTTAYGGWFIDFGHIGAMLGAAVLGVLTGISSKLFYRGETSRFALAAPILIVVGMFIPIHSIVTTVWPALIYLVVFAATRRKQPRFGQVRPYTVQPVSIAPRHRQYVRTNFN
jgi:hypothetical protein